MQQLPLIDQIKNIVADLDIDAEGNVSFKGIQHPNANHPNASPDVRLYFHLVNVLYSNCYTGQSGDTIPATAVTPEAAAGFVGRLKAANHNQERFDHGWEVAEVEHGGNILVRKGASRRTIFPGDFLRESFGQALLQSNERVKLFVRPELEEDPNTGGFYHAFGETQLDFNPQNWVRLYFHLAPTGAEPLLEFLTTKLNEWQVPYQFKCLHNPASYGRHDSAVLYLDKRYLTIVFEIIKEGIAQMRPWLQPGVPLFSKQVTEGIGFAENPFDPNESFGTSRCKVLAQGLVDAWKEQAPKETWLSHVLKSIERSFLSTEEFYRNPNSKYPYQFPDFEQN
ncbi:MAG: hypothetical protein GC192_21190 [Bacteroidetes bacterium]|nr:hypothetical protein [Bacteroidota bacterium]